MICATSQASDQPSDQSLCLLLEYSIIVKILTEHPYEFLSLKRSCTGLSETTLFKISHCWKSHVAVHTFCIYMPELQID